MEYEGTTYRPPIELDTPLLQVTVGCAHNQCTFCSMYRDVAFRTIKIDQIESDIKEIKYIFPKVKRIFLVNGDAFVLSTQKLKTIAQKIIAMLPECETIAMYAAIRNIRTKTDEALKELKAFRINDLYVGVETGDAATLEFINKGHTLKEAEEQLERLNRVGMDHIANLMLGVAGAGKGLENAAKTADFLNRTNPKSVWIGTTSVFEGAPLHQNVLDGKFSPATEIEMLEEEKELLRLLKLEKVRVYGVHPTNTVKVSGILPGDRRKMIDTIDAEILKFGRDKLSQVFPRSSL